MTNYLYKYQAMPSRGTSSGSGGPSAVPRTFALRKLTSRPAMDRESAKTKWGILSGAIRQIFRHDASELSFEDLYRNAYNLVLHKFGDLLYDGVSGEITAHLRSVVEKIRDQHGTAEDGNVLLRAITEAWSDHHLTMIMVRDILMYMDRTYVPLQRRRPVYDLGLHLFRTSVWEASGIRDRLSRTMLDNVREERGGRIVAREVMRAACSMLVELGRVDGSDVHGRDFEEPFLAETATFYRSEGAAYMASGCASDYVRRAETRLGEEAKRAANYLAPGTGAPLRSILDRELIEVHAEALVASPGSGVAHMIERVEVDGLKAFYRLFNRVPKTLDVLRDAVATHVRETGKALHVAGNGPVAFVKGVLEMRDRYGIVVNDAFGGEKRAQKRVADAFEDFINMDSRAAGFLVVYVDELLKTGLKGMTDADIEASFEKVIAIFRYIHDKDVFESYYKQSLAKRLLSGRFVSDDAERSMVARLKAECGYQFTNKLEGMFNDMRISKETMECYKRECNKRMASAASRTRSPQNAMGGVDLTVDVLTTGYWPSQAVPLCQLPDEVNRAINKFSSFYNQKHTGRKLSWKTSTGFAEIRATFDAGRRHDLCVSTYQMCILALFNTDESLTLEMIRSKTDIPEAELNRHLISLCTPKHRILRKASKGKYINENDTFTFNGAFTSKMKRVKIPLVSMKETIRVDQNRAEGEASSSSGPLPPTGAFGSTQGGPAIPAPVEEDRRHLIEAAIVRVMKARKNLGHNDLIAEVTRQLSVRFNPSPQFVKKRIESLIEREYLERSESDRRMYMYVA